jgi:DNA-binding NarL/FixJ family response regulator
MDALRVLLVEDHETVRSGLRLIIDGQPDMTVVGEADDGAAAVSRARSLSPDIVVMDVSMPGMNGVDATREVRAVSPLIKVVVLTRHRESGYVQLLLKAGASAYVLKQSHPSELLRAIRASAMGGTYVDPSTDRRDMLSRGASVGGSDTPSPLSPRETQVLKLIASGHSNKEIATLLDVSVKTVETHKANAMQRLGFSGRVELVRYAMLHGWLDE